MCVSVKQGSDTLVALMEHPTLLSATNSFKAIPERKFSVSDDEAIPGRPAQSKWVYLFEREYATVDPALVDVCFFLYFLFLTATNF